MKFIPTLLTLLTLACAAFHIRAEHLAIPLQIYTFKPLTMLLIIAIAGTQGDWRRFYLWAVLAGLFFSMIGDILLMPVTPFLMASLISFLFAHFCYIAAFKKQIPLRISPLFLAPLLAFSLGAFFFLKPYLGAMQWPVLIYIGTLSVMTWQAYNRWATLRNTESLFAFIGALLFMGSDLSLSLRLFRGDYPGAVFFIFCTYFAAQYLIALSTKSSHTLRNAK